MQSGPTTFGEKMRRNNRRIIAGMYCVRPWMQQLGDEIYRIHEYCDRSHTTVHLGLDDRLFGPRFHFRANDLYFPEAASYGERYLGTIGFRPVELMPVPCGRDVYLQDALVAHPESLDRIIALAAHGHPVEAFDSRPETDRVLLALTERAASKGVQIDFRTLFDDEAKLIGGKRSARALAANNGWDGYLFNESFDVENVSDAVRRIEEFVAHYGPAHVKDPHGASGVGSTTVLPSTPRDQLLAFVQEWVRSGEIVMDEHFGDHVSVSVQFVVTPQGWRQNGGTRQVLTGPGFLSHVGNVIASHVSAVLPQSWTLEQRMAAEDEIMRVCGFELDWAVQRGWNIVLGCDLMVKIINGRVVVKKAEWNVRNTGAMPGNGSRLQANQQRRGSRGSTVISLNTGFHGRLAVAPVGWQKAKAALATGRVDYDSRSGRGVVLCGTSMLVPSRESDGLMHQKVVLHAVGDDQRDAQQLMRAARRILGAEQLIVRGFDDEHVLSV